MRLLVFLLVALSGCAGRCPSGKTLVKVGCEEIWIHQCIWIYVSESVGYLSCVPIPYESCKEICQ